VLAELEQTLQVGFLLTTEQIVFFLPSLQSAAVRAALALVLVLQVALVVVVVVLVHLMRLEVLEQQVKDLLVEADLITLALVAAVVELMEQVETHPTELLVLQVSEKVRPFLVQVLQELLVVQV
jgi:hypothetical protein